MFGLIRKDKIAEAIARARSSEREKVEREASIKLREIVKQNKEQHQADIAEKDAEILALEKVIESRDKAMLAQRASHLQTVRTARKNQRFADQLEEASILLDSSSHEVKQIVGSLAHTARCTLRELSGDIRKDQRRIARR